MHLMGSCHGPGCPETKRPRPSKSECQGEEALAACWAELLGGETHQQALSSEALSFLLWVLWLLHLSEHENRTTELILKGWTLNIRPKKQMASDAGEKGHLHT